MEYVKAFNAELSALYDVRPPISKAKMTAITRSAIKAIKFYKHVVQSVEKFILKCKSEYKVPGLYVIDSIVRQSRHQFGMDKDVFSARFSKNIQQTFVNLFKCPPEDKSKIIRVLNLWQKNHVFAADVIQPLFDLADPNNPIHKELSQQVGTPIQSTNGLNVPASNIMKGSPALQKTPTKGNQQAIENTHHGGSNLNLSDPNVLAQLQQLQRLLSRDTGVKPEGQPVHFDKKLLDFDYGDEEEEVVNPSPKPNPADPVTSLLTNPEVLRQLQTLQQSLIAGQAAEMDADKMRKLQEMRQQEEEFDKHLAQTVPNLPFASECEFKPNTPNMGNSMGNNNYFMQSGPDLSLPPPGYVVHSSQAMNSELDFLGDLNTNANPDRNDARDIEVITLDHGDSPSSSPSDERYRRRHSQSRDRSRDKRDKGDRDRDRRSRRSRSRSRSKSRSRRHRSRSRDRERDRIKEKERETERERERKKRGLPPIKKENLSVCSTTLWVGHLSKLVHQEDLSDAFGEFGEIVSIDLIPPRGCAFIVMNRRQDAARCLLKLKNHVLHGKAMTLAWAPGKGVKGKDLKDYWEGDLGISYIPWNKLSRDTDIEMLEDGGMLDEDTMPDWMKARIEQNLSKKTIKTFEASGTNLQSMVPPAVDTSQPPPMPGSGMLPPMSMPLVPPPFQLNRGLLAPPVGMNMPPGMMPNVPIGVPPPNLTTPMMPLGIGSPFQGPPGLLPPPHLSIPGSDKKNLTENQVNLASPSFGLFPTSQISMSQEDNMDVEMEEADMKLDKPMLHDESSAQFGSTHSDMRANLAGHMNDIDEERSRHDDRDRRNRDRDRDRDRERERERDRDREKDRDRDRGRDKERDRGREKDREKDSFPSRDRDRRRGSRDRDRNERDYRDGFDSRGRDKGRDFRRDLRDGRDSRDPFDARDNSDRDRERRDRNIDGGRSRERDSHRDTRWGDNRDRSERDFPLEDHRDREKALNKRLQEMAYNKIDRPPSRERQDSTGTPIFEPPPPFPILEPPPMNTVNEWGPPAEFDSRRDITSGIETSLETDVHRGPLLNAPPNPVIDRFMGPPAVMQGNNDPRMFGGPRGLLDTPPGEGPPGSVDTYQGYGMDGPRGPIMPDGPLRGQMMEGPHGPMMEDPRGQMMEGLHGPMMDDPRGQMMEPPRGQMMEPPRGQMMEGPHGPMHGPMMNEHFGPPMMDGPPHHRMRNDRFMRGGRRNFRDNFGPRMRGPGPDFFPPRDSFGPRGPPMMRGPGPDFGPRMMRPQGQHKFHPRGGQRGPRQGFSRKDRNFPPRFEGPYEPHMFEGPPQEMYDGPPQEMYDGPPQEMYDGPSQEGGPPFDGPWQRNDRFEGRRGNRHFNDGDVHESQPERRSRWGDFEPCEAPVQTCDPAVEGDQIMNDGNTTPLRDEPELRDEDTCVVQTEQQPAVEQVSKETWPAEENVEQSSEEVQAPSNEEKSEVATEE